jgi:hypothetical protein
MSQHDRKSSREYRGDEIDLGYVLSRIGAAFRSLYRKFVYAIFLLPKRPILSTILILTGVVIGCMPHYLSPRHYRSGMTVISKELKNDLCSELITSLNEIAGDGNITELSRRLNIGEDDARQIIGFKYRELFKPASSADTIPLATPFRIEAMVLRNTVVDTLESGIVYYLENNPYAIRKRREKETALTAMAAKLNGEISQIDSLKIVVAQSLVPTGRSGAGFFYGQPIDPVNVYREGVSMYKDELDIKAQLNIMENIQVLDGMAVRLNPSNLPLSSFIVGGLFIGFALAAGVGLLLDLVKVAKDRSSNNSISA